MIMKRNLHTQSSKTNTTATHAGRESSQQEAHPILTSTCTRVSTCSQQCKPRLVRNLASPICKQINGFERYYIYTNGTIWDIKYDCRISTRIGNNGYARCELRCSHTMKQYSRLVHRLLAEHFLESWNSELQVDHIDRNRVNNDLSNLRMVTHTQNMQNRSMHKNNKSGYTGIRKSANGRYIAEISYKSKMVYLGTFTTCSEAINVRDAAVLKYRGIRGITNLD